MTFIVYSEIEIAARFNVTPAQIDRASRVLDCQTGKVFYQVTSQTDADKEPYEVRWNSQYKRLTCNCAAGQKGVPCWHKRAASASAFEYRQSENLQARKEAEAAAMAIYAQEYAIAEKERAAILAEVENLKPGKGVQQARPFTLHR